MRVLLINKFAYHRGGAERAFLDQARWLRAAGHSVALLSQGGAREVEVDDFEMVPPATFDSSTERALIHVNRLFWSAKVYAATCRVIDRFRPNVALVHNVYHQLGPSVLVALARRKLPSVMILHDQKVVCPAYSGLRDGNACSDCANQRFGMAATHGCGGSRVKGALLAAESFWQSQVLATYDDISIFVAPSEFLRGRLAEMGFRHPVVLLRNGVELDTGPIASTAERLHVGFAGRLSSEKGVGLLLDAARRLPGLRFRVAGSGPEAVALRRRIEQENLTQVELLGHLDQRELRAEMRGWRLAVVPSIMYENCPYAVLDAMACHVPVLGADAGGMSELAANGRALTFKRGDAGALAQKIDATFTDLGQLQQLAREGVRFVQGECSPERHVRGLVSVLSKAAAA